MKQNFSKKLFKSKALVTIGLTSW